MATAERKISPEEATVNGQLASWRKILHDVEKRKNGSTCTPADKQYMRGVIDGMRSAKYVFTGA